MATHPRRAGIAQLLLGMVPVILALAPAAMAIKDATNQGRWAKSGGDTPDKEVPGFLINLGPTGARAVLTERTFIVKYIFKGSPAVGKLKEGDVILGCFGKQFSSHTFGGSPHGYEGPIMDMGMAIEAAEGKDGKLPLNVSRDSKNITVTVELEAIGAFGPTYPYNCKKSELLRTRALKYLADNSDAQRGASNTKMAVTLALLSSDNPSQQALGRTLAQRWSGDRPNSDTWSWNLSHQAITLSEYYILSRDSSVLPTLKYIVGLIEKAQWTGPNIQRWKASEFKNVDQATLDQHQALYDGGFGHCPYPEVVSRGGGGYGPMQYTTILAVTARQLAARCSVPVDADLLKRSMDFIHRGTNEAGYVAYGGEFTLNNGPVDPVRWKASRSGENYVGRCGCAIVAHELGPEFADSASYLVKYRSFVKHAVKSMPDGHADSNLGIFWGIMGAAASEDPAALRAVLDYHKAFFNMMRCCDGSYAILPGRDYADDGYYHSSRYHPTGTMALAYGLAYPKLRIQGVEVGIPGVNPKALKGSLDVAYKAIVKKAYRDAARALVKPRPDEAETARSMMEYIDSQWRRDIAELADIEKSGDILGLSETLARLQKVYKGIEGFDKAVNRYEKDLQKDPWRKEVQTGKAYMSFLGVLQKFKSASAAKKLDQFAKENAASIYGKWAAAVVKEFNASGTVTVWPNGKPFDVSGK